MNPMILSEEPISVYDVQKELNKIKKRGKELNIRVKKLDDFLNNFNQLKLKQAEELEKDLIKLDIPRLREAHIKKLMDIIPETPEEVKFILSAYPITINKENLNKIVSCIQKYKISEK